MRKYFINYKKLIPLIILITVISSLGIFALGTEEAEAAIEHVPIPVIGNIILAGLELIKSILSKLLYLSAQLADGVLGIADFTSVGIVTIGWEITRDISNMFFILILMIIAFATIFKAETYGMKKLLPKLIIAALLINFSLVIAGAIIDFSQILTDFFIQGAAGGKNVSTLIMNGLQIHTLYQHDSALWQKLLKSAFGASFAQVAEAFFAVIILMSAVFAFAAFTFFLIIRIIILWLLLILAPIAWLLMILPKTRNLWEQWWGTFIKWCFFAPIYAFFLYIVLVAIQSKVIEKEIVKGIELTEGAVFSSIFASRPQIILQYIFIILMLFGGLIAAQKLGVYGASGAISIAKSAGKGIGKGVGKASWRGVKAGTAAIGKAPGLRKIPKVEEMKRGIMAKAERIPIIGKAVGGPGAYQSKRIEKIQEERKKIANRTPEDLERIKKQTVFTKEDRIRKVAAMEELAEKGKLTGTYKENEKDLKMFKQTGGDTGKVIKYRPDFAPINKKAGQTPDKAIREAVSKIKPADIEKIQLEALTPKVIVSIEGELTDKDGRWKGGHLAKAAESNPVVFSKIKEDILESTKRTTAPLRKAIEDYLASDAGKAVTG